MPKIEYKKNDLYDGTASYTNVMYTEQVLSELKEEVYNFELTLSKKYKHVYNSEYSYELGLFLIEKLKEYTIVESERHKFWDMLREYVNEKDTRRVFQSKQREPYEYCYRLANLDKDLALKYPRSRWDHLFDCVTAREDVRLYDWLKNVSNEEFNSSNDCWQMFVKGLNTLLKNKDTSIFEDDEMYDFYDEVMYKAIFIVNDIKKNGKLSNKSRNDFFIKTKNINHNDIDEIKKVLIQIRELN